METIEERNKRNQEWVNSLMEDDRSEEEINQASNEFLVELEEAEERARMAKIEEYNQSYNNPNQAIVNAAIASIMVNKQKEIEVEDEWNF